jgi:two-component system, chemotaxis family, protein-glutamate methylesterase/glutaminase
MSKIKVLVVDDSAVVRKMLTEILDADPGIDVVGSASDPYVAREKIKKLNPDVLTLDVEMPRMDGITFLTNLMRLRPIPVVMVSTLTEKGADVTFEALELGAVDFITKPKLDFKNTIDDYAIELVEKVKVAAGARIRAHVNPNPARLLATEKHSADVIIKQRAKIKNFKTTDTIIAIGASTGGTEAIREVLEVLPPDTPGIVIAQHIPENFSASFAQRMDKLSPMTVYEASDGQQILQGHVYIAPGSHHLLVARDGARYICRLSDGPAVNRHRPSVDVLFRSVAQNVGKNALGVILTGMGNDGAAGLKEMLENGAKTFAQNEMTSVVWGMPGEAVKHNAVNEILPLGKIAPKLISLNVARAA